MTARPSARRLALTLTLVGAFIAGSGAAQAAPSPIGKDSRGVSATTTKTSSKGVRTLAATIKARRKTTAVQRILGTPPSGSPWFSGVWNGKTLSADGDNAFGTWRGRPVDGATTYPERWTFDHIARSEWHITTFTGVPGRLSYGLPLLPDDGSGTLAGVAAGEQDAVWTKVASDLVRFGRGDAIVRIGWEANGSWYRWGGTPENAADYRAAYRHVAGVMKKVAPNLVFDFDIACGFGMPGSTDRLAPLNLLYPGDDVVDIVGCDMYDMWQTKATNSTEWAVALAPPASPGIADVAAFARAHNKGMSIPEWGVVTTAGNGNGDNPFFITQMRNFMVANADIMTFEAYFDEPMDYLQSSLLEGQNPQAAATYQKMW